MLWHVKSHVYPMKILTTRTSAFMFCLALSPVATANWIYVSNEKDDTISVIDSETEAVVKTIAVGERPRGVTLSHDYKYLYICASDSDTVQMMDLATDKIIHDLPSGEDPEQFALHPNNKHLYISNEDDAIATVVDIESRKVIAQIDVGVEPCLLYTSPSPRDRQKSRMLSSA